MYNIQCSINIQYFQDIMIHEWLPNDMHATQYVEITDPNISVGNRSIYVSDPE
jgi:hypothetical protein